MAPRRRVRQRPAPSNCSSEGLDRQVDAAEHVDVLLDLLAQRGQVVAGDDGVDAAEEALFGAVVTEGELAAACKTEGHGWHGQAECGHGAQCLTERDQRVVREWCARARVKEVHRHLAGLDLGQLVGELGAVLKGLAHSDDAAGADFHADCTDILEGLFALLPGMRGDHVGEEGLGGLQVVVVALGAHVLEALGLLTGEGSEREGDFDIDFIQDGRDGFRNLGEQVFIRGFHSCHDAEFGSTCLGSLLGGLHQLRDVEARGAYGRIKQARLRAEVAILRAAAGLNGDDAFHGHVRATPLEAGLVGDVRDLFQLLIRDLENLQEFFFVEADALLQGLLACDVYDAHAGNIT